jgi:hypothetical protein
MHRAGSESSIGQDSDACLDDVDYVRDEIPRTGSPPRAALKRSGSREKLESMLGDQHIRDQLYQKDATQVLEDMIGEATQAKEEIASARTMIPVASKLDMLSELLEIGHSNGPTSPRAGPAAGALSSGCPVKSSNDHPVIHEADPVSVASLRASNSDGQLPRSHSASNLRDDSWHSKGSNGESTGEDDGPASMEEIIAVCINKVCRRRKFGLGNIWIVQGNRLVCAPTYQTVATLSEKLQFFGDRCREITFAPGEGMPGRTWTTVTEQWVVNVQDLTLAEYPRLEIAKACGVQTTFTVPFVVCGVVLAVCEFVVSRQIQHDPAIIQDIKTALSEALQLKVHLGLHPLRATADGRNTGKGGRNGAKIPSPLVAEDPSEKYMRQPLYLRAVSEQWTIPRSEIHLRGTIGEGEEGIVYDAQWRMMPVVAKAIKRHLQGNEYEHEVSVLSHLRHPNLVLFLGACLDDGPLLIVSEFMDGGSLEQYMESRAQAKGGRAPRTHFSEIHRWCVCIGRALAFLHQVRDLRPCARSIQDVG